MSITRFNPTIKFSSFTIAPRVNFNGVNRKYQKLDLYGKVIEYSLVPVDSAENLPEGLVSEAIAIGGVMVQKQVELESQPWLIENWKRLAFVRFLEIWKSFTLPELVRGLAATETTRSIMSGIIGALNGNGIHQNEQGKWVADSKKQLFSRYITTRLSNEGVENAKDKAYQIAGKKRSRIQEKFAKNV